ncbi:MAG: hypothetical protein QXM75_00335 [Candidatus Diapherotrites archaeon]
MAENKIESIVFPLKELFNHPCTKRARRAMLRLRRYLAKKYKVVEDKVFISQKINETIFARGPQKIPRSLSIQVLKDGEKIKAYLADEKVVVEEKVATKGKEVEKEAAKTKEVKKEASEKKDESKEDKSKKEVKEVEEVAEKKKLEEKKEMEKAAQRTAIKRRQDK